MYVKRHGSGARAFLALHGWAGNHRTFDDLLQYVPEDASFYSADLPGYGQTPAPVDRSIEGILNPILEAVDQLGGHPVTLVGYCGGALLALECARRNPEGIARIVAIDAFAYLPWYLKVFTHPTWGRHAYMGTFANPVGRWLVNSAVGQRRTTNPDPTGAFKHVNHDVAYEHLLRVAELSPGDRFAGLRVPVDITYGQHTFAAVRESADIWRRILPQMRAFELRGAGHEPAREAPRQLADVIFNPDEAEGLAGLSG